MADLKKIISPTALLIILALSIGLTPSIPVGTLEGLERTIDIRGEDIWILVLFFFWLSVFLKSRQEQIEKPPLFLPILFWLGAGLVSLLINLFLGNINVPRGVFYFAKELQFFFVYFFTFFHVRSLTTTNKLFRIWLFVALLNIVWVFWQIFFIGRRGEYGTAALNEWGVFPTGAFFLILFIFIFNWWLHVYWKAGFPFKKKYLYLGAILIIIVGILGALSKTVFIAFWVALLISMILYVLKTKTLKDAWASFLLFLTVGLFTFAAYLSVILPNLPAAERLMKIFSSSDLAGDVQRTRFDVSALQLQEALERPLEILGPKESIGPLANFLLEVSKYAFGRGKGAILLGPESHNHYLRNFIETGIMGSLLFLTLMVAVLYFAWKGFKDAKNAVSVGLAAGLLVATLTVLFMSIVVDAFIVVKPNMTYWFFAGLTMATLYYGRAQTKGN
ncbi:MAG: hypothetical protein G01um101430_329 [Parcubacteria group bacterium Gr01-1014_30]|nr:MAG: hypothetical protein G01um101430_329 [Parcubacteria group bacterium Gr01-1014_30]